MFGSSALSVKNNVRAPPSAVKEFIAKLATRRDLPEQRSSGGGWSNFLVMTPAQQTSLLKHEDALETAGLPPKAAVLTNLAQRPEHIGPVLSGHVPALLRRIKQPLVLQASSHGVARGAV